MGRGGLSWLLLLLITDRGGKGKSAGLYCGRSSGVEKTDTRYNEWEGVVCLGSSSSSSQTEVGKVSVQDYLHCGHSSGMEKTDTRYNEWEGAVCLGSSSSSSQTEVGKVRVQASTLATIHEEKGISSWFRVSILS